jgi:hypothetical protein
MTSFLLPEARRGIIILVEPFLEIGIMLPDNPVFAKH